MLQLWNIEKNLLERWEFMDRKAVKSSMLNSIGYDTDTQTLELEFKSGEVWQYMDVPAEEFEGLMNAPSHGGYARNNIIGSYHESRVLNRKS
jgi:KTSC domain